MAKTKQMTAGQRIISGLTELHDALADGVDLHERFTIREVEIAKPRSYGKDRVRRLRDQMGMSQAVFAASLGVSAELIRSWEIGKRQVGPLAGRLLELVEADPTAFRRRVVVSGQALSHARKRGVHRAKAG